MLFAAVLHKLQAKLIQSIKMLLISTVVKAFAISSKHCELKEVKLLFAENCIDALVHRKLLLCAVPISAVGNN
jgi:hypothetical protein